MVFVVEMRLPSGSWQWYSVFDTFEKAFNALHIYPEVCKRVVEFQLNDDLFGGRNIVYQKIGRQPCLMETGLKGSSSLQR